MDLLERYKTDFRLSQNHTDYVWQKLILSFSIKAVRYLGFNYSNILYDDPDQRCSVIQLPQLHLLLYSGWDYSFLTLLEEKKLQKSCLVSCGPISGEQGPDPGFVILADCQLQAPVPPSSSHQAHPPQRRAGGFSGLAQAHSLLLALERETDVWQEYHISFHSTLLQKYPDSFLWAFLTLLLCMRKWLWAIPEPKLFHLLIRSH